jgi:hypothetical protein
MGYSILTNLLKNVQSSLGQSTQPMGTPSGLATEQALKMSQAASGKAVQPGQGPKVDTSLERAAAVTGQQAQQQVAQQTQAQTIALQAQEQQQQQAFRLQIRSQNEKKVAIKSEAIQKVQSILDSYERKGIEFDLQREEAEVEQAKFLIRLQDDQYIQQLEMASARERLDQEFVFNVALAESVFGEYYSLLLDNVSFQKLLGQDRREFEREMGELQIKHNLWKQSLGVESANAQRRYEGYSQIVSGIAETVEVGASINQRNKNNNGTAGDTTTKP